MQIDGEGAKKAEDAVFGGGVVPGREPSEAFTDTLVLLSSKRGMIWKYARTRRGSSQNDASSFRVFLQVVNAELGGVYASNQIHIDCFHLWRQQIAVFIELVI